jgi:hypothetical protein
MGLKSQQIKQKDERHHYLDWLRVIGMILVFCFHVGRVFDAAPWHIKNPQGSYGMTVFTGFVIQWLMPLFFLLAGASSYLALKYKSKKYFVKERFKRLIIPFVCGLFILIPPQEYIQQLYEAKYRGSFISFYPHFLDGMHPELNFRWFFAYSHNLWFLGFLFIFSLLALPVFILLRKKSDFSFISRINNLCQKPFGMFLCIIPIAIIQVALRARFSQYLDWADFFLWFAYFLYGYIIQSDKNYKIAASNSRISAFIMGVVCTGIMTILLAKGYIAVWELSPKFSLGFVFYQVLKTINAWSWILFLLGLAMKYLDGTNKFLKYANEAALPFYMIHQTVLFIAAYFIIQLQLSIILKFIMTLTITFLLTVSVYDLFVRKTNITRFIFGLRSIRK